MTWVPFESADMLEVQQATKVVDGRYELEVRCTQSRVGDIARFCYFIGSNVLWVASPMDDDGVPVFPLVNSEGATRCDKILVITDKESVIRETSQGILADLDEYIRSKKTLAVLDLVETYVIP